MNEKRPKNSHEVSELTTENDQINISKTVEDFNRLGFRFIRAFIFLVIGSAVLLSVAAGVLVWNLSMDKTVTGRGSIEPEERLDIKVRISGIIERVYIRQNDRVAKGDLIAILSNEEWKKELDRIKKEIDINRSKISELQLQINSEKEILEAEIKRTEAQVRTSELHLEQIEREYKVYLNLYHAHKDPQSHKLENFLPLQIRKSLLEQAKGDWFRAQKQLTSLQSKNQQIQTLREMNGQLIQESEFYKRKILQCKIHAPEEGIILTENIEKREGDYLHAGGTILQLARFGEWQARILVKEMDVHKIKQEQKVNLFVESFPHLEFKIFKGQVTSISPTPVLTKTLPEGVYYSIICRVEQPYIIGDDIVYSLVDGMSTEAKIIIERDKIMNILWKELLQVSSKMTKSTFSLNLDQQPDSQKN